MSVCVRVGVWWFSSREQLNQSRPTEKDFPCNERIQLRTRTNTQTKKRPKLFSSRCILDWQTQCIYWLPWFLLISSNLYIPPPRLLADITHMPCVSLFGAALLGTHHLFVHGRKAMSIYYLSRKDLKSNSSSDCFLLICRQFNPSSSRLFAFKLLSQRLALHYLVTRTTI